MTSAVRDAIANVTVAMSINGESCWRLSKSATGRLQFSVRIRDFFSLGGCYPEHRRASSAKSRIFSESAGIGQEQKVNCAFYAGVILILKVNCMPNNTIKIWVIRIFLLFALVITAVPIIAITGFFINSFFDSHAGHEFEKVQMGMSRQQVVALLGERRVVRDCGENLWWGNDANYRGKNDGRCVTEERYEYFLSAWGIGYSQDGRVVSKYHYFSE